MSNVKAFADFGSIEDFKEFSRFVAQAFNDLQPVINGKIEFGINIASQTVTTFFNQAASDMLIAHQLNKTGVNYIVCNKSAPCDIYHGNQRDNSSQIFLRSTVSGVTVTFVLF